ncbi:MAG: hypothetical protein QM320_00540, partial [Bacteroidota bacterium]|nr:hypothetical protein [Bacteroidota bacterium]
TGPVPGPWALSDAARALLLELHGRAIAEPGFLAAGRATVADAGLGVRVAVGRQPGVSTVLTGRSGRLVLHDLQVAVTPVETETGDAPVSLVREGMP